MPTYTVDDLAAPTTCARQQQQPVTSQGTRTSYQVPDCPRVIMENEYVLHVPQTTNLIRFATAYSSFQKTCHAVAVR